MTRSSFDRYLALGDSISIDKYPSIDFTERTGKIAPAGLGAPSLLYRNNDEIWPEFTGQDLRTMYPKMQFQHGDSLTTSDFTEDGWTTDDVMHDLEEIAPSTSRVLVTLTVGGNDLVMAIGGRLFPGGRGRTPVPEMEKRLVRIVDTLRERFPNGQLIVATVYDPSDGTNTLGPYSGGRKLEREAVWLREYNEFVRQLPRTRERVHIADIHAHFLGHGLSAKSDERWYWSGLIIEPNARGASEVRRVWLDTIQKIE